MNERIRELNLQALSEVLNGADPDRDIAQMYIPVEFTKKFAELIVQECIGQFIQHGVVSADGTIVKDIQKHFGV